MQIEVLGERYQLQDPIGRGGMATIYRGRDLRMERVVAIKVLREVYSTDPKFVTRFQREAKSASALQHPNIVQVYDYGQSDGNYFIVMELIEGTDLRRYLRSRGVLAVDRAIIIAHDVALGLGAAHRRQIVHRDVKPQNVLVGSDGSIKLTDFGIASVYKDINAERLTTTGMTLGTVQYYAPEQAQGEIVSPAADVYALGIVIYEMLTGRTPFDGDTPVAVAMQHIQDAPIPPSQLNSNIPPALEEIVLRCLEKIPEMRYRDGNSLARALEMLGEDDIGAAAAASIGGPNSAPTIAGTVSTLTRSSDQNESLATYRENGAGPAGGVVEAGFSGSPVAEHAEASTQMGVGTPISYASPAEAETGATRPYHKGNLTTDRESRITGIVTAIILIAALLLLGFSVYLAGELGLLPPIFGQQNQQEPPMVEVPNLINMDLTQARKVAEEAGFRLQVVKDQQTGKVINQNPSAGSPYREGSVITVELEAETVKVPEVVGLSLTEAKNILNNANIRFNVEEDTQNPIDPTKAVDTVTRVDPEEGATLQSGQVVTLYITNYSEAIDPTPTLPPEPTPTLPPEPTSTPPPTPTAPPPTPTTPPTAPPPTPTAPPPTPTTPATETPTV